MAFDQVNHYRLERGKLRRSESLDGNQFPFTLNVGLGIGLRSQTLRPIQGQIVIIDHGG